MHLLRGTAGGSGAPSPAPRLSVFAVVTVTACRSHTARMVDTCACRERLTAGYSVGTPNQRVRGTNFMLRFRVWRAEPWICTSTLPSAPTNPRLLAYWLQRLWSARGEAEDWRQEKSATPSQGSVHRVGDCWTFKFEIEACDLRGRHIQTVHGSFLAVSTVIRHRFCKLKPYC